jgi:hypothetical protein
MTFKEKMKKRIKLTVRQGRRRKQRDQGKERMLETFKDEAQTALFNL